MKMKTSSWSAPEEPVVDKKAVQAGFGILVVASIAYAAILYFAVGVLESEGFVDGRISWPASMGIAALYILARFIEKMVFGRQPE